MQFSEQLNASQKEPVFIFWLKNWDSRFLSKRIHRNLFCEIGLAEQFGAGPAVREAKMLAAKGNGFTAPAHRHPVMPVISWNSSTMTLLSGG